MIEPFVWTKNFAPRSFPWGAFCVVLVFALLFDRNRQRPLAKYDKKETNKNHKDPAGVGGEVTHGCQYYGVRTCSATKNYRKTNFVILLL
ncbi:MAG: hypothetical protein EBQ96_05880 [Proteobacteria bacterium]|nr:hypothetical protein [Pseudomonadota bacterium]